MKIEGCTALVTGANRGLGKAFAEALVAAGAAKVYAAARDPSSITNPQLTPVGLDVTSGEDIAAAAARCRDVTLLINNAGAMLTTPILADGSDDAMRREMEVNVYGPLALARAFAPIIEANGGGTIANMLSVVSLFVWPVNATYCVSKHAALGVTDALRADLKERGIHVAGIYAGFIDTDMVSGLDGEKSAPSAVAAAALRGIGDGTDHILADRRAEDVWAETGGRRASN